MLGTRHKLVSWLANCSVYVTQFLVRFDLIFRDVYTNLPKFQWPTPPLFTTSTIKGVYRDRSRSIGH